MEKTKAETTKKNQHSANVNATTTSPRNFLAAFLLAISLGPLGINRLYTGETSIGWIRFGIFAAGILTSPILVGIPLFLIAFVWGIVDAFLVYHGDRTDSNGHKMTETAYDRKFAKALYIAYVVILVVFALLVLMTIALTIFATILYGPQAPAVDAFPRSYFEYDNSY